MIKYLEKILKNLPEIDSKGYLLAFFSIVLFRSIIESFSSPNPGNILTLPTTIFLHFGLFYFSIFLSILLAIYAITKNSFLQILKFGIYGFPIILLSPIVDLIFSKGKGLQMAYLFINKHQLVEYFLSFSGKLNNGITLGLRIEMFFIIFGAAIYTFLVSNSYLKSFLTAMTIYVIAFFYAAIPNVFFYFHSLDSSIDKIPTMLNKVFGNLDLKITEQSFLTASPGIFNVYFDLLMASTFWLLIFIQLIVVFKILKPEKFKVWLTNLRLERVFYYYSLLTGGIFLSSGHLKITSWFIISSLILFILIFISSNIALWINDLEDISIDKISNKSRPLVLGNIEKEEIKQLINLQIILLITGILIQKYTVGIFILVGNLIYYLYSCKPYNLKRNFILSSLSLSFASIVTILVGFFHAKTSTSLRDFPLNFFWFALIGFIIIINVKDLKDITGDKINGRITLPVYFGEKKARLIIAVALFIYLLFLGKIFYSQFILIFVAFSFFSCYLILNKNIREKYLFFTFYLFIVVLISINLLFK